MWTVGLPATRPSGSFPRTGSHTAITFVWNRSSASRKAAGFSFLCSLELQLSRLSFISRKGREIRLCKISAPQMGCFTFLPAVGTFFFFSHPGQGWLHQARRVPSWGWWKRGSHVDHSEWLESPVNTQRWLTGVSDCAMPLSMWAYLPRQLLACLSLLFCHRLSWEGDSAVCLLLFYPTGEVVWKQNPRRGRRCLVTHAPGLGDWWRCSHIHAFQILERETELWLISQVQFRDFALGSTNQATHWEPEHL